MADSSVEMQRISGQVLLYISASNWPVIFQRIRARLHALSAPFAINGDISELDYWEGKDTSVSSAYTTGNSGVSGPIGDLTEIKMMEYLNLNHIRLGQLLVEINSSIRNWKRPAHALLAITLRKAIWNWIDLNPLQFTSLCESQSRLEGKLMTFCPGKV